MLWQLPPGVRGVLQNDPTLIDRPDYLAPYPSLQAFLKQHPEVARNPTFFFGGPEDYNRGPNPTEVLAGILAGTGLFIAFMTIIVICRAPWRARSWTTAAGCGNADADGRPHEDSRSHAVERGPAGVRADAGWTKLSRVHARPARGRNHGWRVRHSGASSGRCRPASSSRPSASDCDTRRAPSPRRSFRPLPCSASS